MPSKYRKRRRKKQTQPAVFEYELFFDDVTMTECEGQFACVTEKFAEADNGWYYIPHLRQYRRKFGHGNSDGMSSENWTIKTKLTIISSMGQGEFILNLSQDSSIHIVQYAGNTQDAVYNPDVRCLTKWSQIAGWKIPQPTVDLIKETPAFWKQMWDTLIIDSEYFDKRYGVRKSLAMRDQPPEVQPDEEV